MSLDGIYFYKNILIFILSRKPSASRNWVISIFEAYFHQVRRRTSSKLIRLFIISSILFSWGLRLRLIISFLLKLIQWRGSIYWMNWFHRVCFFAIRGTWYSLCCFSRADSVYLLGRFLDDLNLGLVGIISHSGSCLCWPINCSKD